MSQKLLNAAKSILRGKLQFYTHILEKKKTENQLSNCT